MTSDQSRGKDSIHLAPIRLALIGAGIFARDAHIPSLKNLGHQFETVAVYSRTEAGAVDAVSSLEAGANSKIDVYTDVDELLAREDIEAVNVVLPIPIMVPFIEKALRSGKHVISEKPIAPDSATAHTLMGDQQPDQIWMVGENWRYESAYVRAAEIIANGEIGRPLLCHWALHLPMLPNSKYYGTTWRRSGEFQGGLLLDGGVHHIAALRMMLGEITEVNAMVSQMSQDILPADTLSATLSFASGAQGTYAVTYAAGSPWPPNFYVVGDGGALRVDRGNLELTKAGETRTLPCPKFDGVELELVAFGKAIRNQQAHLNSPDQALQDVLVIEAMLKSAQEKRLVQVGR